MGWRSMPITEREPADTWAGGPHPISASAGRLLTAAAVGAAILVLAGCGDGSPQASSSTKPAVTGKSLESPVGLVAIGHSGLTGESSDPDRPQEDALENSWATGTTAQVKSVYLRMVAVRPQTEGHVSNTAQGGAVAARLVDQAEGALNRVPAPAVAIIQTIDNDIRCDGTDAAHVPEFGADLDGALALITQRSPKTRVLVVGQMGRPATAAPAIAQNPGSKVGVTGTGICDFFDPAGKLVPSKIVTLTGIIEGYEKEQARVCATYEQCSTDEGVFAGFVDGPDTAILGHLTVAGHAQAAALIWPKVEALLR